jgi:hypothetical protein
MKLDAVLGFLIVMFLMFVFLRERFDPHGAHNVTVIDGYKVHNMYQDQVEASAVLAEINKRVTKLLEHLEHKYVDSGYEAMDPDRRNHIDRIKVNDLDERILQLIENYSHHNMSEISPKNRSGYTSYTEGKTDLVICLRKKHGADATKLHDINTLTFVVLHELTHMMNDDYGHGSKFWDLFRFLLLQAIDIGIYKPEDYSVSPINYCGLLLNHSPLY